MRLARNIENRAEADRVFHDFGEGFVGGFQREVLDVSGKAREDIRRAFDEISPALACNSITILGSGFFSSFFISIVSQTLSLTRRHGGAHRIHTDLESTASWMHEQLNDPNTSVEEVYETLQLAMREGQALRAASSPAPA